jgi:hypothetical protein
LNVIFVAIGIGYLGRKAYLDARRKRVTVTPVSTLTYQADPSQLEAAA